MCRPLPSVLRARLDPILLAQDQNLRILDFPLVSLAQEEPQADERSDDDDEGDDGVEGVHCCSPLPGGAGRVTRISLRLVLYYI